MSSRLAPPRVLVPLVIALNFISFTNYTHAQQCHMAHDKNALKALQERAATGDADAECGLGKQYEHALGVAQDNTQAVLWLRKAAEQGNIAAQVELGVVFDNMLDYAQAFTWYSKAAEQGNARAQYNLGLCYLNGESVNKDMARALDLFRKAANQGDAIAQHELGVMYQDGVGVQRDYTQAANYFRESADQGIAESQYGLGFLYLNGNGVPKDFNQATAWMLKAAEQGETKAQYNLGSCYINGEGVSRDLDEGYFWIFLADTRTTDNDLKGYAENSLEALTKVMKRNDIKRAQKRAQAWLNERHSLRDEQ
ncbi:MAG: tetratricopeptide repeat protein [Terracidiphilus sp.]